jgi:hypothetical protein
MTDRKTPGRSRNSQPNSCDRLKDEIYRQMYRLEAKKPGADLNLAIALLRGWVAQCSAPEAAKLRDWLNKICPICLLMIETAIRETARRGADMGERCAR